MTIDEVHEIVQKYEWVLRCEVGQQSEIYYYFSTHDDDAIRVKILYNDDWTVFRVDGEDTNSRTIRTENCVAGRLGEDN